MNRHIVGLVGLSGSGKSEVARMLEKHRFHPVPLGDPLKEAARILFSFTEDQVYGSERNVIDPRYEFTPRFVLQRLGNDIVNQIHPHALVLNVAQRINESLHDAFVIEDIRYPSQFRSIKAWGGEIWLIERPGISTLEGHSSEDLEFILDGQEVDRAIINNGTLDDLIYYVGAALDEFYTYSWSRTGGSILCGRDSESHSEH